MEEVKLFLFPAFINLMSAIHKEFINQLIMNPTPQNQKSHLKNSVLNLVLRYTSHETGGKVNEFSFATIQFNWFRTYS